MSKVSIVMPAYNAQDYIEETIASVLAQTCHDYELIIVDDGSTDRTRDIASEFVRKHSSIIRLISQKNQGPSVARNSGIQSADGEYIAFLDSDDLWAKEKLELQLQRFHSHPEFQLVHTNRKRIHPDGQEIPSAHRIVPEGQLFDELIWDNCICTSSVMVRRKCLLEVGGFDESPELLRSEDYDLWLRLAHKYEFGFVSLPVTLYRVQTSGYNRSNIKETYLALIQVIKKNLDLYDGDAKYFWKVRMKTLMYRQGHSLLYVKDYASACWAFGQALKYDPLHVKAMIWGLLSFMWAKTMRDKQ
ncbi:MAG: glycosyltransferase family 2 protein [Candidatus Omnitrophica bacterium]|nr:glycosyltransferase family 2 protein [Candidatus Omnitrophota bacterium]